MRVDSTARSLLLFDLSTMPVGANVISADLVLCYASISPLAQGRTHELNRVGSAWSEAGVTWNNQPSGAPGSPMPFTVPLAALGCVSIDVTTPLRAWALGGPNYGFRIKDQNEGTGQPTEYITRENPTTAQRPTLNVTFTP